MKSITVDDYKSLRSSNDRRIVVFLGSRTAMGALGVKDEVVARVPDEFEVLRCEAATYHNLPYVVALIGGESVEFPIGDHLYRLGNFDGFIEFLNRVKDNADPSEDFEGQRIVALSTLLLIKALEHAGEEVDLDPISAFIARLPDGGNRTILVGRIHGSDEWILLQKGSPLSALQISEDDWFLNQVRGSVEALVFDEDDASQGSGVLIRFEDQELSLRIPNETIDTFIDAASSVGWNVKRAAPEDLWNRADLEAFALANAYSNPFWRMSDDQVREKRILDSARLGLSGAVQTSSAFRLFWSLGLASLAFPLISFIVEFNKVTFDEYGNEKTPEITSRTHLLALVAALICLVLFARASRLSRHVSAQRNFIRSTSMQHYRTWKENLRSLNPHLFSEVIRWEQEEARLAVQRQMLATAQEQLAETRKLQSELSKIQSHLDPRRPRVDGDKY